MAAILVAAFQASTAAEGPPPLYKNARIDVERRVADLLARMTLEEKVRMLSGSTWMDSAPNTSLGIPAIRMTDGPAGVRPATGPGGWVRCRQASPIRLASLSQPLGIRMSCVRWAAPLVWMLGLWDAIWSLARPSTSTARRKQAVTSRASVKIPTSRRG